MKPMLIVVGCIGVLATAYIICPALMGPVNRVKNTATEKLNEEYLVDNYKAEYVKLAEKRHDIKNMITDFTAKKVYNENKLKEATRAEKLAKEALVQTGTSDLHKFRRSKDVYESAKLNASNLRTLVKSYSDGLVKLQRTLEIVESNMSKAKMNVETLASKKTLVDTVKDINKTLENIKGTGDPAIGVVQEKLEEERIKQDIKLQVLNEDAGISSTMTKAEAEAYLKTIQPAKK
jgi:hypothetical protein